MFPTALLLATCHLLYNLARQRNCSDTTRSETLFIHLSNILQTVHSVLLNILHHKSSSLMWEEAGDARDFSSFVRKGENSLQTSIRKAREHRLSLPSGFFQFKSANSQLLTIWQDSCDTQRCKVSTNELANDATSSSI